MRKMWVALMALAVLCLSACGWQGTGVVVEKTHRNSYTYVTLVGKVPVIQRAPERWGYHVRDDATGKIESVNVNYEYWRTHDVGSAFDNREKK